MHGSLKIENVDQPHENRHKPSRELEAFSPRSDSFLMAIGWIEAAGRGLPGCWPLLLGGDTWRTLAIGGGGAQGLHCKNILGPRVLSVIGMVLSLYRRSPRARNEKVVSVKCTCHGNGNTGVF
jgi:hypothetical protein